MVVNKLHDSRQPKGTSPRLPTHPHCVPLLPAVLGRFVYALNIFCKEAYGMDYDVSDYFVYEFAKVGLLLQLQK